MSEIPSPENNENEDYGEKFELPYYEHYFEEKDESPYKNSPAIISEKDLDDVLLDRNGNNHHLGKNELFTELSNLRKGQEGSGSFLTRVDKDNNRVILFGSAIEGDASTPEGKDVIVFKKNNDKWNKIEKE